MLNALKHLWSNLSRFSIEQIIPRLNFVLFALIGIAFLLLLNQLYAFNRLAVDDYFSVYAVKHFGVFGTVRYFYHTWSIRPVAVVLSLTLLHYLSEPQALYLTGLLFILGFWLAMFVSISKLLPFKNYYLHPLYYLVFSLMAVLLFFYGTISIPETWFWFCSSYDYLLPIIAFVFLFNLRPRMSSLIFNSGSIHPLSFVFVLLLWAIVFGTSESFALFAVFVFGADYIYQCTQLKRLQWHWFYTLVLIGLLSFLLLYIQSPGLQSRKQFLHQANLIDTLYINLRALGYLLLKWLPTRFLLLSLISMVFWLLPIYNNPHSFVSRTVLQKFLGVILCLVYVSLLPTSYIMSDRGPDRALTISSMLITLGLFGVLFFVGSKLQNKPRIMFGRIAALGVILFLSVQLHQQYIQAPNYAQSVDNRIAIALSIKPNSPNPNSNSNPSPKLNPTPIPNPTPNSPTPTPNPNSNPNPNPNPNPTPSIISLPPLAPTNYYYPAKITSDTSHFSNRFFKMRFDLPLPVSSRPENP